LGLIPEDKIAEIRDRTDIVQVIGEYVTLKRAGVNHKGLCPFHQEKSPSFNVNGQRQFFHCFGCGKSGDVFTFLGEVEGRSFVEVARDLAKKAGIDLPEPERSREAQERARAAESERARLVRLHELTAEWYRAQLAAPVGERARAYLATRGLDERTQEIFKVGYASGGWDALVRHLEAKRVPHELAERAGLIKRRESARLPPGAPPTKATHFDVFVDRVMYALTSPMGEVIGFGGRVLESVEGQPKYKNSPETPLYKKGENLFGLHAAKHAIRKGGKALVVEGNFDVMTLHQHGLDCAVAPQGTAITAEQVALLGRFAREVVLMLDADPAGRAATLKVVHLLAAAELPARIVALRASMGKKVDPDDLARNDLPRLQKMVAEAQDAVEFFFDQVASSSAPTVPGRVAAVEECVPLLRAINDPLARDLYVERLAALLKIEAGLVRRALRGPGAAPGASPTVSASPKVAAARRDIDPTLGKLLALLAQHGELAADLAPPMIAAIADPAVRGLVDDARGRGAFDAKAALDAAAPDVRDAVARALFSDEFAKVVMPRRVLADIADALLPRDRQALEAERRAALESGDDDRARVLSQRIRTLSTRLQG
jgi:DNA primase